MKETLVIVTGARQGIGKAIADKFFAEGCWVEYTDIIKPENQPNKKRKNIKLDVTNEKEIKQYVNYLSATYGNMPTILINNAGKMITGAIKDVTPEDVKYAFEINALSEFMMIKHMSEKMNLVSVTNMSSNAGLQGFSSMSPYCMSKFAIIGLTQVAAKELAKKNPNVNVNAICPSPLADTESQMSKNQVEQFMKNLSMTKDEVNKMLVSRIPAKRLCLAKDIADLAYFLATDGKYITGQAISLTGGMIMVK